MISLILNSYKVRFFAHKGNTSLADNQANGPGCECKNRIAKKNPDSHEPGFSLLLKAVT